MWKGGQAMNQRKVAIQILEKLESAGFQAYLVGGCVRDLCLGKEPNDYDICTDAFPEQVQQLFSQTIPTGIKHGTVIVVQQGIPIEVTTFRRESKYEKHRRPKSVTFVSDLKEDLSRRDFTINAMAQDRHGKIYDFFQGKKDLEKQVIRCVGDPAKRFQEDALRMVRAIRFATRFQFSLDAQLIRAIQECKKTLKYLSIERIVAEIEKIWSADKASIGCHLFWELDLLIHLPVFSGWKWEKEDAHKIQAFDWVRDRIVRWSYLLYLGGICTERILPTCRDLRLSSKDATQLANCYQLARQWKFQNSHDVKVKLLHFGQSTVLQAYQLNQLIQGSPPDDCERQQIQKWWKELPVRSLSDLMVNGRDLITHYDKKPGPWIRQTLNHLLISVALGKLPNEKQILLEEGCQFGTEDS